MGYTRNCKYTEHNEESDSFKKMKFIEKTKKEAEARRAKRYRKVLVNGKEFKSVKAAADYMNAGSSYLKKILIKGAKTHKGYDVSFAD